MDIKHEIDEFNRTRRQQGEPVMTQKRLSQLAGVSEALLSLQANDMRGVTDEQLAAYRRILRLEVEAAA